MERRFYLDTSIWLDFFEERGDNGKYAKKLLTKIMNMDDKIVYSDVILFELNLRGYNRYELSDMFRLIKPALLFVEASQNQTGRAKDIALKRKIPKRDALHAIIARDNNAILVTLDRHFQKILDIAKPKRPQDLI